MLPELFIAFHISPDSREVAFLEDIMWGRESYGEYVFYLASNTDAKFAEDPSMIDFNKSKFSFEVHVSFEESTKNVANTMIDRITSADGDTYELAQEIIEGKNAWEVVDIFNSSGFILPVMSYLDKNQAAWVEFGSYEPGKGNVNFKFVSIEKDRTIEITAASNSEFIVDDVYNKWIELIEEYKSIPYYRFTGASVE